LPVTSLSSRKLALVNRSGAVDLLPLAQQPYLHPHFSPDGKRLVFETDDEIEATVWVVDDLQRPTARRLTLEGRNVDPIWTPDGQYVVFQSDRQGDRGLFRQRADGSLPAERLTTAEPSTRHLPNSWTPDGKTLAFESFNTVNIPSIWTVAVDGDRKPRPLTNPQAMLPAQSAAFSPDGRWLAYTEILYRGGPPNLFVQPFPATGAKYQLTTRVGNLPVWSRDGKRILYEVGTSGPSQGNLLMADFREQPSVSLGSPSVVAIPPRPRGLSTSDSFYDVTPDDRQIVTVTGDQNPSDQPAPSAQIDVVVNWFDELKRLSPTK
jgi:Tol biopolymer transport system component